MKMERMRSGRELDERTGLPRYTMDELKIKFEDLRIDVRMGLYLGGQLGDVLVFRQYLEDLKTIKIIYQTITEGELAIVWKDEWEEFKRWKETKNR